MIQSNDIAISNNKMQVTAICEELARHSSTIDLLLTKDSPISNLVIQGHFEAHLEKMEDSLVALCHKYEIAENYLTRKNEAVRKNLMHKMQTQKQGMKLLLNNIQKLEAKVRNLLLNTSKRSKMSKISPLRELSRKLNNDLCRTTYLLQ